MAAFLSSSALESLQADLQGLVDRLPTLNHGDLIYQALAALVRMADEQIDRLDWKILRSSIQDLEKGFQSFYPYRHIRKISIFGSSRLSADHPVYQMATDFFPLCHPSGFHGDDGSRGGNYGGGQ